MPYALYIASVIGALALLLMMPRRGYTPWLIGALLGGATLGGLWLVLARFLPPGEADVAQAGTTGSAGLVPSGAMPYYYIFSFIAIGAAARVITHTRPVYSALWFVMVVLATAGLFVLLSAEFMAFALVIIYAGAILVTYVFVIMLASQPGEAGGESQAEAGADRVAREPAAAVMAGFLLLAVLLTVAFDGRGLSPSAPAPTDAQLIETVLTERPAARLAATTGEVPVANAALANAERVGLDLFRSHPLGLELAGVILLVSLVGAVVIARQRVEEEHD